MVNLNRKMEYALVALKHIFQASPGQRITAKEIADHYGAPFDAVSRVLQKLAHAKLLQSEQGIYGGYTLVQDLERITLLELMEMVSPRHAMVKCKSGESTSAGCSMQPTCNIVMPLEFLNRQFKNFFKTLSVKEVLEARTRKESSSSRFAQWSEATTSLEG